MVTTPPAIPLPTNIDPDAVPGSVARTLLFAQSQIGYNGGGTTGDPDTAYGAWWGYNFPQPSAQWCAMFTNWVLSHAGVPCTPPPNGDAMVSQMATDYTNAGLSHPATEDPNPGDIVIYQFPGYSAPSHAGIVESYDPTTQKFSSVQGNTGDFTIGRMSNVCRRVVTSRQYVVLWCTPQYVAPPNLTEWIVSNEDVVKQIVADAVAPMAANIKLIREAVSLDATHVAVPPYSVPNQIKDLANQLRLVTNALKYTATSDAMPQPPYSLSNVQNHSIADIKARLAVIATGLDDILAVVKGLQK